MCLRNPTPDTRCGCTLLTLLLSLCLSPVAAIAAPGFEQVRLADGLFARGMYELALREYVGVVDQPGATNGEAMIYRMAECYRELGRNSEASAAYDRVITGFPETVYAQRAAIRQAESAVAEGRFEDAAVLLRTRAEGSLDISLRPAWRYYRAHAENQRGHPKIAEPIFRRLIEEDGGSPYASFARLELAELLQAANPASPEIRTLLEQETKAATSSPVSRQAAMCLAAHLYSQKDFADSADLYLKIIKDDATQADAVRPYAVWSSFKAGRWEESLRLSSSLASCDGLYVRANSLRQLGRTNDARKTYGELLSAYPTNSLSNAARYEAAALALRVGDFSEAALFAAQVKPTAALGEDILWIQAEAARGEGRTEDAVRYYDQLYRDYPRGGKVVGARMQAARLLLESGRWEESSDRYRAIARDPAGHDRAADALFASAYARVQLKQPAEAVADWTILIRDFPAFKSLDDALYGCAQAQTELGQTSPAEQLLTRLLKDYPISPRAPEAHYLLGTILEADEKWDEAGEHYQAAARENPNGELSRRIQFRRIAVLQRQGRQDEAGATLNKLLSAPAGSEGIPAPLLDWLARWNLQQQDWASAERAGVALAGQDGVWSALGWYQAGRAREEMKKNNEAREAYRKVFSTQPTRESVESCYRLGRLALTAGDSDEARSSLTRAAEMAGDEALADLRARSYFSLAELEEKTGQMEQAARTFLSVALLYDDPVLTPESLYRAAHLLEKLGRGGDQKRTSQELRERYPDSEWAKKLDAAL